MRRKFVLILSTPYTSYRQKHKRTFFSHFVKKNQKSIALSLAVFGIRRKINIKISQKTLKHIIIKYFKINI